MRKTVLIGTALATATTAFATQGPVEVRSMSRVGAKGDPNQVVCVRQSHISSPLNIRRICRTRAEWTQLRTDTRNVIERIQYYKPTY
jgi:hypothetical protein